MHHSRVRDKPRHIQHENVEAWVRCTGQQRNRKAQPAAQPAGEAKLRRAGKADHARESHTAPLCEDRA